MEQHTKPLLPLWSSFKRRCGNYVCRYSGRRNSRNIFAMIRNSLCLGVSSEAPSRDRTFILPPSQTRTSGSPAYGSSTFGFCLSIVGHYPWSRQWLMRQHSIEPFPRPFLRMMPAPSSKTLPPLRMRFMQEPAKGFCVPSHPVIVIVALQPPTEAVPLFFQRLISSLYQVCL